MMRSAEVVMAIVATRSLGLVCLAVWLIVTGLSSFVTFLLPAVITGLLALIAGILILVGK
jgi:hypothetical protein